MRLLTLGGLRLEGASFSRAKPLVLLAYLAVQGPSPRGHLAALFFPGVRDARDSLSTCVGQLRRAGVALDASGDQLTSEVACDVALLRRAAALEQHEDVLGAYEGPFLDGVNLELGEELEEWLVATRERCADDYREACLALAERDAAEGRHEAGARRAADAVEVPHATPLDVEGLRRVYTLLKAGRHPRAERVRAEAAEVGVALTFGTDEAQKRLGRPLLGRDEELRALRSLPPGAWAWVHGGAGAGKTTLLSALPAPVLPGRPGAGATLAPLLRPGEGAETLGRAEWLLVDGWEEVDAESRRTLLALRASSAPVRVVVTSRRPPAVAVQRALELGPLSSEALSTHPGVWEASGGVPVLVAASLAGEAPERALGTHLSGFSPLEREVYAALVLLPDPVAVRRALELSGERLADVLEPLVRAGLVTRDGDVRARRTAERYAASLGRDADELSVRLARSAHGESAVRLYRAARHLWDDPDRAQFTALSLGVAQRHLAEGRPADAVATLGEAEPTPEVRVALVRALERAGQYARAAEVLADVDADVPEVRASVAYRLGRPDEARAAAERALDGPPARRALGLHVLGNLALDAGRLEEAAPHLRGAAALYLLTGDVARRGEALVSLAIVRAELGEDAEAAFREVLDASENDPLLRTRVLVNLGRVYERRGDPDAAAGFFRLALDLTGKTGALDSAAKIWNNLGALHHKAGRVAEASEAYHHALDAARAAQELLVQANVLANLGTLHRDASAMEEAIRLLDQAGHPALAERHRARLEALRQA